MRNSILSLITFFATFSCFAEKVTIDFSDKNDILTLLGYSPESAPTTEIDINGTTITKNGISLCLTSTNSSKARWGYSNVEGEGFENFLTLRNYDLATDTNVDLSISASNSKLITSIVFTFDLFDPDKGQFTSSSELDIDITNKKGTVTWTGEGANLCFCAKNYPFKVSKIEIYCDTPTAINDASQEGLPCSVIASSGNIKVKGEWNSIRVFNSNGQLIAADKESVDCSAGVYLVQVNGGKAELVIVK